MRRGPRKRTGAACAKFLEPLLSGVDRAFVPATAYLTEAGLRSGVAAWGWQERLWLRCRKVEGGYEVKIRTRYRLGGVA